MAYANVSSTTTPHQKTILDALKTAAEAEGWATIENAYADGTYTRYVFESPDADFYAVFWYHTSGATGSTSTTNSLYATVCEEYSVSTRKLKRPAMHLSTATACASASDTSVGTTEYTLADTITTFGFREIISSSNAWASSQPCYINVFSDWITVSARRRSTDNPGTLFVGKFTALIANASTNDPKRFIAGTLGTSGAVPNLNGTYYRGSCGATRSAMNGGKAAHDWRLHLVDYGSAYADFSPGNVAAFDMYQNGVIFHPIVIVTSNNIVRDVYGFLRGRLPRTVGSNGTGAFGDTFEVDGTTYIAGSPWGHWVQKG